MKTATDTYIHENRNTMTKMYLKVTVVTFATPQLEKISRLTASPFPTESPPFLGPRLPFSNFSISHFLGTFGKAISHL